MKTGSSGGPLQTFQDLDVSVMKILENWGAFRDTKDAFLYAHRSSAIIFYLVETLTIQFWMEYFCLKTPSEYLSGIWLKNKTEKLAKKQRYFLTSCYRLKSREKLTGLKVLDLVTWLRVDNSLQSLSNAEPRPAAAGEHVGRISLLRYQSGPLHPARAYLQEKADGVCNAAFQLG